MGCRWEHITCHESCTPGVVNSSLRGGGREEGEALLQVPPWKVLQDLVQVFARLVARTSCCSTRRRDETGVSGKGACWRHWVKLVLVLAGVLMWVAWSPADCWGAPLPSAGLNREGFNVVLYLSNFAYQFPVISGHCFKRKWYFEE